MLNEKLIKMKKLLSLAALLMIVTTVFSQTTKKELEATAELFGMGKKAMVANFVELPENHKFWTIYEEYEAERAELGEKRYNVLLEYAGNYVNYSDHRLEIIMDEAMKVRKDMEKLLTKYYKRIKKECDVKTASQFYMVQRYFDSVIRSNALGNLPIIEK